MVNFEKQNIKMSVLDTHFYYNGENITCKVDVELDAPDAYYFLCGGSFMSVCATAKCHPDDEFSIEKGKKIAQAKAEARAYVLLKNEMLRRWGKLLDTIEALALLKDGFIDKAEGCNEHNKAYIKRITNDNTF